MNKSLPCEIQSVVLKNPIWRILYDKERDSLIVDHRSETSKKIDVVELALPSLKRKRIKLKMTWWENMIQIEGRMLFSIGYHDQKDPANYSIRKVNLETLTEEERSSLPKNINQVVEPSLYDLESDHHKTVASFLGLELLLPCEYLEFDDNIIISYYIRSENGFERYLLLIRDGSKAWKVRQDDLVKGFASGAFFVANNRLIFVRDRNEVCIYNF